MLDDDPHGLYRIADVRPAQEPEPEYAELILVSVKALGCPFCSSPVKSIQEVQPESREDAVGCPTVGCAGVGWYAREAWNRRDLEVLDDIIDIQASDGNWNYEPYMHGFLNGMLFSKGVMDGKMADLKDAPKEWLCDKDDSDAPVKAATEPIQDAVLRGD